MRGTVLWAAVAVLGAACPPMERRSPPQSDTTLTDTTPSAPVAQPTALTPPAPPPGPGATKVGTVEGFLTPESVLHDPVQDIYFVSNINGSPTAKDNNGFISRVRPDGAVENLKFIEGGHGGATLNAPKGLALRGDTLWVADIDMVRSFDAKTGAPRDSVSLAGLGAVFLNDIAIAQTGALYITDTGIRFDDVGNVLHPGPDRIFRIGTDRQVTVAVRGDTLAGRQGAERDRQGPWWVRRRRDGRESDAHLELERLDRVELRDRTGSEDDYRRAQPGRHRIRRQAEACIDPDLHGKQSGDLAAAVSGRRSRGVGGAQRAARCVEQHRSHAPIPKSLLSRPPERIPTG